MVSCSPGGGPTPEASHQSILIHTNNQQQGRWSYGKRVYHSCWTYFGAFWIYVRLYSCSILEFYCILYVLFLFHLKSTIFKDKAADSPRCECIIQDTCIGGLWRGSEELACAYPVGSVKKSASGGFAAWDGPNMLLEKRLYLMRCLRIGQIGILMNQ